MFDNVYAQFFHQKHTQFKYVFTIFACAHKFKRICFQQQTKDS